MGKHLTTGSRLRIIYLAKQHFTPTEIERKMGEEGISVTRTAVYSLLEKFSIHGTVANLLPPPRGRKGVTNELLDFIDKEMEQDDELTAKNLQQRISQQFGENFSVTKLKDLRRKLGWLADKTKYCQLVKVNNREKRLTFAQECLANNDQFDDVIWSDECNVQLDWNGTLTFHRWWEPCPQKGKPKHPFKVSVWAAISKRGASSILVFTGIMEKVYYSTEIISNTLAPFIKEAFPSTHRFMQDNDPKHTSNLGKETLLENNINWWRTPPESPDMNPIENFWHELKYNLRSRVKPRKKDELIKGIQDFWLTVTPEKCRKYIGHIQRVLPVVVERGGKASGF